MDIGVGDIILHYQNSIIPPKHKYGVVVSTTEKWCFLINSENREHYYCLPILKQNHSFLKHDSFIGCAHRFGYSEQEVKKVIGKLSKLEIKLLYDHTLQSRTISKINKELILKELILSN